MHHIGARRRVAHAKKRIAQRGAGIDQLRLERVGQGEMPKLVAVGGVVGGDAGVDMPGSG